MPKCLVPVGGRPIIERLLERLLEAGIQEVICIVGYRADLLERRLAEIHRKPPVTTLCNPLYATSNSIVSLLVSKRYWNGELLIVNSDLLFSAELLNRVTTRP